MTTVSPAPSPHSIPPHHPPSSSSSKPPVCFSPPLIAMLIIIATAFITITYSRAISRRLVLLRCRYRQWRRRRRLLRSYVPSSVNGDIESVSYSGEQPYDPNHGYGLDDDVIKTIPLSVHARKSSSVHECAVCLLEFEDDDYVRTLPVCFHSFHVDCIDIWLRCHANCPLCRSSVFRHESPFIPIMSPRIRPTFDDVIIIQSSILEPSPEPQPEPEISRQNEIEITQEVTIDRDPSDDRFNRRNFLLKRSYSFGFERNLGLETVSPWRYRRSVGSLWSKKPSPSPFSLTKTRVFSFRHYRGTKSPFFRRRSCSFLPLSEPEGGGGGGGGGSSSSRRRRSFASPNLVVRQGRVNSGMFSFSSSRLRSGDPEALLSPERYHRR